MKLKSGRLVAVILSICMLVAFLPTFSFAAGNTITKLDLVVPMPEAGMSRDEYKQSVVLQAANTEYGDLVAMGELSEIRLTGVNGDFDRTNPSNQKYIAGNTYQLIFKPIFMYSNYLLPHDADMILTPSKFTITINGVAAETVQFSSVGAPGCMLSYTIPAPSLSTEEQAALDEMRKAEHDARHADLRKIISKPYTVEEANSRWIEKQERAVVAVSGDIKDFKLNNLGGETDFITKLIFDVTSDDKKNETYWAPLLVMRLPNLKELWLGEGVDPVAFCEATMNEHALGIQPVSLVLGYKITGNAFADGGATLYVPSSSLDKAAALAEFSKIYPRFPYTIKLYDGDVYTAQRTNSSYEWCTNHSYTTCIESRDRVFEYSSCDRTGKLYYSCEYCGKCEYDKNHTYEYNGRYTCRYNAMTASDAAYAGVDIYGNHLFWYSCMFCGRPRNVAEANPTVDDWKMSGSELTYEQYVDMCRTSIAQSEERARLSKDAQPYMFALSDKTTANVSAWAQDGVNHALDNNMLATALI